jgi:kynurenine 3-monooxygenase
MTSRAVTIIGAGLCGSLLAMLLARRGLDVRVYERLPAPGTPGMPAGRSINLALSARGIRALRHAGIFERVEPLLMPMRGRMIHAEDGRTDLQPYGQREHEVIYSVSRAELNRILIEAAVRDFGVAVHFEQEAMAYDRQAGVLRMKDVASGRELVLREGPFIAADGAGSVIRRSYGDGGVLGATEDLLEHGYKELTVPPGPGGRHQLDPGALHIWPRGGFMLIALPNPGGDFTLTLFLPNEGAESFAALEGEPDVQAFFEANFADVTPLVADPGGTFGRNPTGILGTVRCRHWHDGGNVLLVGDAAHAIVPFHGQGMNLAFEDCVLLDRLAPGEDADWRAVFAAFEAAQRDNANAIADMALENYVEMRDTVRDPKYVLRKELSFELERRLPDRFIPRYSMVMFHDEIPYAVARRRGALQQELLEELTRRAGSLADIDLEQAAERVRARLGPIAVPASRT